MPKPAAALLAAMIALPGCAAAPATMWADALVNSGAYFQIGGEAAVVAVPIAGGAGSGAGSRSGSAPSGAPAAAAPTAPPPSGGGGSSSAPAPAPTPQPAAVLSNTLDAGPGAIAGVVLDVVHAGTPVPGTIVTVVAASDPTKQAVLRNGPDGRYRVGGIALGTYRVIGAKPGHAAGSQAVEVILFPGAPEVTTVNLALSPP